MGAAVSHIVMRVKPTAARPPLHLRPHADLAQRVLLPGDPHRALAVAQDVLESPKIFNHARGLWGYTGIAPDGELMSVQATGMGGPSAAIVIEELIGMGATTLVRIGTCGAFGTTLGLGELVTADRVIPGDGASRALGASGALLPDAELTAALQAAGGGRGVTAVSSDLFYDDGAAPVPGEAEVVEMEAATLLRIAELRGVRAACLLAVSDVLDGGRQRLDAEALQAAGLRLGQVAAEALTR
jgi:uridine phosphorylase